MSRDPIWDHLKAATREKFDADRERFLDEANQYDDGGWTKYSAFHWSRIVNGKRLDYWPSRRKWRYNGKTQRGNVYRLIKNKGVYP